MKSTFVKVFSVVAIVTFVWLFFVSKKPSNIVSENTTTIQEIKTPLSHPLTLEQRARLLYVKGITKTTHPYNVVSFALYGNHPRYIVGAFKNSELVKTIYPGWVCRYYHDKSVKQETLDKLLEMGSELVDVSDIGIDKEVGGMFWRFLIAADTRVDRYIVRDVDSRLNERELAAVEEWITTKFTVHSMRDHLNHNYPLNGGMWGAVKGAMIGDLVNIFTQMEKWKHQDHYMADMNFLDTLWPFIKEKTLSHDAYFCDKYPNCRPFPTERVGGDHVGLVPGWE